MLVTVTRVRVDALSVGGGDEGRGVTDWFMSCHDAHNAAVVEVRLDLGVGGGKNVVLEHVRDNNRASMHAFPVTVGKESLASALSEVIAPAWRLFPIRYLRSGKRVQRIDPFLAVRKHQEQEQAKN